jgi:hypothetical protein
MIDNAEKAENDRLQNVKRTQWEGTKDLFYKLEDRRDFLRSWKKANPFNFMTSQYE